MKIEHVEKGRKAKFETVEDVLQTFFSIARAVYRVASDEDDIDEAGVLTMLATTGEGKRIRIRVDYLKEGESE